MLDTLQGLGLSLTGVQIHTIRPEYTRVQFRFPRSKKRRIRKKWAQDPRNWKQVHVPRIFSYLFGGASGREIFVMDDISYAEMKRQLEKPKPPPKVEPSPPRFVVPAHEIDDALRANLMGRLQDQVTRDISSAQDDLFLSTLNNGSDNTTSTWTSPDPFSLEALNDFVDKLKP